MAIAASIAGDLNVSGKLNVGGGASISGGTDLDAAAVIHEHRADYSQPNTTATSETRAVAVVKGTTGTLRSFSAGSIAANIGAATVTVDLRRNGSTVLSAVITLDSGNTARVVEAGTINSTALAAGDLLEVVVVATAGGGTLATGLMAEVRWTEDYSG